MTDKAPEIITLKALCAELKIDTKEARERLRDAVRDPKNTQNWQSRTSRVRLGSG